MDRYANRGGDSGIVAYETGPDSIAVQFHDGSVYLYTAMSCGTHNCGQMKSLAIQGEGLNAFINTNVKKAYERRIR
jgi:hypothetical protein